MNKNNLFLCSIMCLLSAAIVAPSAYSQDNSAPVSIPNSSANLQSGVKKRQTSPEARKRRQLSLLRKEAGLTPDQESKVTPIISKYVDDLASLKNDSSLSSATRKEKRKALHSQYVSDIDAVLTPDQQKNWAAANTARIERLRAARGGAQPTGSPAETD